MRPIDNGKSQCTDIRCQAIFHDNPLPVAVIVIPIELESGKLGLFMIVRGPTMDGAGKLAFPGGYQERGETSRQAAVRELEEETGLAVGIEELRILDEAYAPKPNVQILFWGTRPKPLAWLDGFRPSTEAASCEVCEKALSTDGVAFTTHAAVMAQFFVTALGA